MPPSVDANWLVISAVVLLALLVAWWLLSRASRGVRPRERRPDVLDEGAPPAQRNQALIDAPPAAAIVPAGFAATGPDIMAGMGEVAAAAAAEEAREAAPPPAAQPLAGASGAADDLRRIKGVGPKLVVILHGLGITRYDQIAAWTDEDVARVDAQLGSFAGRARRDNWVEQCQLLAAADTAAYEARFGRL